MTGWRVVPARAVRSLLPAHLPPGMAVVYAVLFVNGLVKVGYSSQPRQRVAQVASEVARHHGAGVERVGSTPPLSLPDARRLERVLLARLRPRAFGREWFLAPAFTALPALLEALQRQGAGQIEQGNASAKPIRAIAEIRRRNGRRAAREEWTRAGLPPL